MPKMGYAQRPQRPNLTLAAKRPLAISKSWSLLTLPDIEFDFDFFQDADQFLADCTDMQAPAFGAFQALVNSLALQQYPIQATSRVMAVAGSTVSAVGLSLALAQRGEKVCLLEIAQAQPLVDALLDVNRPRGLSDLFVDKTDLEHLILTAKLYRQIPGLYVIGQGNSRINWLEHTVMLDRLFKAFLKKFHRVILCVPGPQTYNKLSDLMDSLQIGYRLLYTDEGQLQPQVLIPNQVR